MVSSLKVFAGFLKSFIRFSKASSGIASLLTAVWRDFPDLDGVPKSGLNFMVSATFQNPPCLLMYPVICFLVPWILSCDFFSFGRFM